MEKLIQVKLQVNGGKKYYYPVNSLATSLCELLKQKTLTELDMDLLKEIGYNLEVINAY